MPRQSKRPTHRKIPFGSRSAFAERDLVSQSTHPLQVDTDFQQFQGERERLAYSEIPFGERDLPAPRSVGPVLIVVDQACFCGIASNVGRNPFVFLVRA